jgi:hypothetical protein
MGQPALSSYGDKAQATPLRRTNRAVLLRESPFKPHSLRQDILADIPWRVQKKYPHKVENYLANIPLPRQTEYERDIETYSKAKDIKTTHCL